MSENDKPPAPPAEQDTSAPAPNPAIADDARPKLEATLAAVNTPPADDSARTSGDADDEPTEGDAGDASDDGPSVYELVREHAETSHESHPTVHEFAELRGLSRVRVFNPKTEQHELHPCWQVKALLARFRAHGLHDDARVPHDVLELALHEALHGRI